MCFDNNVFSVTEISLCTLYFILFIILCYYILYCKIRKKLIKIYLIFYDLTFNFDVAESFAASLLIKLLKSICN